MAGIAFAEQGQPAGQPAQPEPSQVTSAPSNPQPVEQTSTSADTGLTAEQIRAIIAEETAKAIVQANRTAQSLTAKAENRIKTDLQRQLGLLQQAGVQVGTEQAQAIENVIRQQVANEPETTEPTAAAQPQQDTEPAALSPVDTAANAIMDSYGVVIEDTDPEAAMLDMSSERAYLVSVLKAAQVKQARTASARMPVGGGVPNSGSPTANLSGRDTLAYAYRNAK